MFKRPTRRLRPTPENRDKAVDLIIAGLAATEQRFTEGTERNVIETQGIIDGNLRSVAIRVGFVFLESVGSAVNRILARDAEGWERLRVAFTRMYWGWEDCYHDSLKENISFEHQTGYEHLQVMFHGLALASGAEEIAMWSARFLRNLFHLNGVPNLVNDHDGDFVEFYWQLLNAQIEGRWVPPEKLTDELGAFRPLLETVADPVAFRAALVDYCDLRLSRAYQYVSPSAKRPRHASHSMFLFETQWIAIFPLELLALQAIYRQTTGRTLSLEADHPLLHTPLMKVPPMLPLVEEPLSQAIRRFGEQRYGEAWRPLQEIPIEP